MKIQIIAFICLYVMTMNSCIALDNGLGLTPQMAWNSWNAFGCGINETLIQAIARAVVQSGLAQAGYHYVNMDDCWAKSRNASGFIEPDPVAFPSGIKALADYVHSLGLKFGLYSDAGTETCAGRPGSLGYETKDAEQYAAWGVDYLKYDNCNNDNLNDLQRYTTMKNALNATGRQIFFSLCDWAVTTAPWGKYTGNSWRTTTDINPEWDSWTNNLDQNGIDAPYAGPGGWNDPDMLEVGNGDLTHDENLAHFSLWALVKAPLILGNDLRTITPQILEIITNPEVLAVSQDKLGQQGIHLTYTAATDAITYGNLVYADICNGGAAQQFIVNDTTGAIASKLTGLCLGQYVPSWSCGWATPSMGAPLYLQSCGQLCSGNLQKWKLANNTFQSNFGGTPLCAQTYPKVNTQSDVLLWNCSSDISQQWTFTNGIFQNGKQCLTVSGGAEVWAGGLSDGSFAVALFNRAGVSQNVTLSYTDIPIKGAAAIRDLWEHTDVGNFSDAYTATVHSHGVAFLKVTPL